MLRFQSPAFFSRLRITITHAITITLDVILMIPIPRLLECFTMPSKDNGWNSELSTSADSAVHTSYTSQGLHASTKKVM